MALFNKKKLKQINIKITVIFYIISLIFMIFIFIIPLTVKGQTTDIDYTFEREIVYDSGNNIPFNTFNIRNSTRTFTEFYNATYSFTYEPDNTNNTDIGFVDFDGSTGTGYTTVLNNHSGHSKVIGLIKPQKTDDTHLRHDFVSGQTSGIIEFWMYSNDTLRTSYFNIWDTTSQIVIFRITGNLIQWYDGLAVGGFVNLKPATDNTWYHVKFDFDCLFDYATIYINGVNEGTYYFSTTATTLNQIRLIADTNAYYLTCYDAIGFDWNVSYIVGMNELPTYQNIGNFTEIDRYEFYIEGTNNRYTFGEEDASGWTFLEGATDLVNTNWEKSIPNEFYKYLDSRILVSGREINTFGIRKDDFKLHDYKMNVSLGIEFSNMVDHADSTELVVYSRDNSKLIELHFWNNKTLMYQYNSSYQIPMYSSLALNEYYELNCYINVYDGTCKIDFWIDGSFQDSYLFPLFTMNKNGLSEIEVLTESSSISWTVFNIDYVGIYSNGYSMAQEYGYLLYNITNVNEWNYKKANIINITTTGYLSVSNVENIYNNGSYIVEGNPYNNNYNFKYFNGTSELYNVHPYYTQTISNPFIAITLGNSTESYNLDYLEIEGTKLTYNTTEYTPEYTYNSININESYFYVDTSNRLQYFLTTNDSNLEYIQLEFDIDNRYSTNYSFSIGLRKNRADLFSECRLIFSDTSYYFVSAVVNYHTDNTILEQGKEINKLIFLATDNDNDVNNTLLGYYVNPRLIYYPNIAVTISILNFFEIIPVISMIVLLPVVIGSKAKLRFLIIPLVMVMSIISYLSNLIPLWLTVVINLFCILYYFIKNKYSD